jgi:hypothetical protein
MIRESCLIACQRLKPESFLGLMSRLKPRSTVHICEIAFKEALSNFFISLSSGAFYEQRCDQRQNHNRGRNPHRFLIAGVST